MTVWVQIQMVQVRFGFPKIKFGFNYVVMASLFIRYIYNDSIFTSTKFQ